MLNIIIKAIFWVISKIADIILIPITAVLNALLPNLSINLDNIFNYLHTGISYIPFILKTIMIPNTCITLVVFVFTSYITFITGIRVYQFIMKIYNNFKP